MKSFAKIAGGLGLLLVLSSPLTYFLTSGSALTTGIKAGLGAVLIGLWAAFAPQRGAVKPAPTGAMGAGARSGFYFTSSVLLGAVLLGLLFAVNFIAARREKTWDLTAKKIYSLAPQTVSTLKGLKDPVEAIAFLPGKNPAYDAVEALLRQYAAQTDKFTYRFKDPERARELTEQYKLKEGQTTVVLTQGPAHTTLNLLSEQEITNALIKLTSGAEQKVYFTVGHGEWPLEPQAAVAGALPGAEDQAISEVPKDAALVIVAGAQGTFLEAEAESLSRYLEQGGRLLVFLEQTRTTGLEAVLAKYGVGVGNGLVVEPKSKNPLVAVTDRFSDHDSVRLLKSMSLVVRMPLTRALVLLKEGLAAGASPEVVLTSLPSAWEELKPAEEMEQDPGERVGPLPMILASTRQTKGATDKRYDEARVLVYGSSQMLLDANYGDEANRNLIMNGVGWASAQVARITIRPPDRDISTLDIDDALMGKLRFIAMDLIPLCLVGFGLAIWLSRRNG
jgi:ABC-type uncharacterized transport system